MLVVVVVVVFADIEPGGIEAVETAAEACQQLHHYQRSFAETGPVIDLRRKLVLLLLLHMHLEIPLEVDLADLVVVVVVGIGSRVD